MSAGGGCEAIVTARIRCGCVRSMECSDGECCELMYGAKFPLRLFTRAV